MEIRKYTLKDLGDDPKLAEEIRQNQKSLADRLGKAHTLIGYKIEMDIVNEYFDEDFADRYSKAYWNVSKVQGDALLKDLDGN